MKNKLGFTIIELLAVIVVLAIILLSAVTIIRPILDNSEKSTFIYASKNLIQAAQSYYSDEYANITKPANGKGYVITAQTLHNNKYIKSYTKIKDSVVVIYNNNGVYDYYVYATNGKYNIDGYRYSDVDTNVTTDVYDYDSIIDSNIVFSLNGIKLSYNTNEICFTFDSGTGSITDYNPASNPLCPSVVIIPTAISGVNVTRIGSYAFNGNGLTSVYIPETVTRLEMYAFFNNRLTSVIIPNSVTRIDSSAFSNNDLISVTLSNTLDQIGSGAFQNNNLQSLYIPSSVTRIDYSAFAQNELTEVNIPTSVTTFGGGVFTNNLFPEDTAYIFDRNGATIDYTTFSCYAGTNSGVITIPNGVTVIDSFAFKNHKMSGVIIPNTVTSIGTDAFYDTDITSITLPTSLNTISNTAFAWNGLTAVTIPSGTVTIGTGTFSNNPIVSINIPSTVTSIGSTAFVSTAITSITMGRANTTVGDNMINMSNNTFRTAYLAGGIGTYTGTYGGAWTKS